MQTYALCRAHYYIYTFFASAFHCFEVAQRIKPVSLFWRINGMSHCNAFFIPVQHCNSSHPSPTWLVDGSTTTCFAKAFDHQIQLLKLLRKAPVTENSRDTPGNGLLMKPSKHDPSHCSGKESIRSPCKDLPMEVGGPMPLTCKTCKTGWWRNLAFAC